MSTNTPKSLPPRRPKRGGGGRQLAAALQRAVDDVEDVAEPNSEEELESGVDTDEPLDDDIDGAAYRIGEVAQLVGVDAHVLRYWESEFRLKPERSASGQRVYRQTDLSQFLRIKGLLHDEGYTIAGARRVLDGTLEAVPAVDATRVKAALERVRSLREQVREVRDQIEIDLFSR